MSAAIYSIYLYFIGKRFIVCTKYLSKVIFDGLLALFKSYLKLALAEFRFIIRLVRIPFSGKNHPKAESLYRAVNLWLRGIVDAFIPSWVSMVSKHPTKFSRFMALIKVLHKVLLFAYSFVILRQLITLIVSECLRL